MDDTNEMYASAHQTYESTPEIEIKYDSIDYQTEAKKRADQAANTARDQANRQVWSQICNYWDVSDHDGNLSLVRSFCGGEITVEKFQLMLGTPGEAESLDWKGTRDRIISEIASLLEDKTGKRMTQWDLANAVASMRYWPKAKLRARLAELKFKVGKSASDARALLDQHRAAERAQNPFHPFETMPDSITAATIKAATADRIKYLNSRYGQEQVRARLNSR